MADRYVIFNADDFGASFGVNRGVIDAHINGVVTSASLLVTGRKLLDAVERSHDHPHLSIGLHWDVWGEDEREFDLGEPRAVRAEFGRQLDIFRQVVGREPTHVDSHKHAHLKPEAYPVIKESLEGLDIPLRGDGRVAYVSGFYAQWEWQVTELKYVSAPFLKTLLRDEVVGEWTEIACHPGHLPDDFSTAYNSEREVELATLKDPEIAATIRRLGLTLASYDDYARVRLRKSAD